MTYQNDLVMQFTIKPQDENICGVYMIHWPTGHFYIGSSLHIHERFGQHLRAFKHKRHYNVELQKIYNRLGNPSLTVLTLCDQSERLHYEQQYIDDHFNDILCCNVSPSAYDQKGSKRRPETIEKQRERNIGKTLPQSVRDKIAASCKAKWAEQPWHNGLSGEKNPFYGKRHTAEAKIKMRKSKNVGRNNIRAKLVINLETGIFYDCATEAAESSIYKPQHLRGMLNGGKKNKTSFRYI